jgi:hypothetical protein
MKVLTAERLSRLRDRRLQGSEVAEQRLLATLFHDETVEKEDLSQAEVPH